MKTKFIYIIAILTIIVSCDKNNGDISYDNSRSGQGGSMARFTISKDHLYIVDNQSLNVIDISDLQNPEYLDKIEIGFGIETIFPYKENLFLGAQDGMYIYSISNPDVPSQTSMYEHITSCDPVVVNDSLAFVTLRNGGSCQTEFTNNQLDIIDITNLNNPDNLVSFELSEPYGLGLDSTTLFICHGDEGLGIYDVSDIYTLKIIDFKLNIDAFDVIPYNGILLVVGESGFYQYDYSNLNNIAKISEILIGE